MYYHDIPLITTKTTSSPGVTPEYFFHSIRPYVGGQYKNTEPFFQNTECSISGSVYTIPNYTISADAKKNLIYPISFILINADKHYYTRRSGLSSFELRYTLKGTGYLEYERKTYLLRPGDGFFIDNRKPHYYRTEGDNWVSTVLHFDGAQTELFFQHYSESGSIKFTQNTCPDFDMMQYEIIRNMQSYTPYREYKIFCLFTTLLGTLLSSSSTEYHSGKHTSDLIKSAVQHIEEHYASPIHIDDLSEQLNISRRHLCRELKKYIGFSPKEYLQYIRLNHAKDLLKNTDYSIDKIAELTGFQTESYFIAFFKKSEHITPLQYRKH